MTGTRASIHKTLTFLEIVNLCSIDGYSIQILPALDEPNCAVEFIVSKYGMQEDLHFVNEDEFCDWAQDLIEKDNDNSD